MYFNGLITKIIIRSDLSIVYSSFSFFGLPIFAIPAAKRKEIQPALSCVLVLTIDWLSVPPSPTNPVILMQSKVRLLL